MAPFQRLVASEQGYGHLFRRFGHVGQHEVARRHLQGDGVEVAVVDGLVQRAVFLTHLAEGVRAVDGFAVDGEPVADVGETFLL